MQDFKITFQPGDLSYQVPAGTTVKEVMNQTGLGTDFPCGGIGKCGKCRIKILTGSAEVQPAEKSRLSAQELADGIRLACVTAVRGDMVIEILNPKKLEHHILSSSVEREFRLQSHLKKVYLEVSEPSLQQHKSAWQRLSEALDAGSGDSNSNAHSNLNLRASLAVLRELPEALRVNESKLTAVLLGAELVGVEPGDAGGSLLGVAFDIGTTTIVGYLLDLNTGEELAVSSALNPQAKYGGDVISRITYTGAQPDGLETLHKTVIDALNLLIWEAAAKAGRNKDEIYGISIAANTTMHHLFLGLSPQSIGVSPYVSVVNQALVVPAPALGLKINQAGQVFVLPNIAGFVGADTTAVLLTTELEKSGQIKLILDIGTNGEIVLGSRQKMLACSAAAGPAFEGAQITSGMRGADGAIDRISFKNGLNYSVIGGGKPVGICGSALLDGVAGLVELGMLNKRGKFVEPENLTNPDSLKFKERLVEYEGARAFLLADSKESRQGRPILITQNDIRELQLAKGAIAAGVGILMDAGGIQTDDIKEVLLAGAFGNYLDPHSACVIGLIPRELEGKIKMIGNAAGTGAKIALLSAGEFAQADRIAAEVSFIELGSYPKFNTVFAKNTYFAVD